MKRLYALSMILILLLTVSGCAQETENSAAYIEPAQLNADEEAMAKLLGMNSDYVIYDFVLDDTVQSVDVRVYQLVDGKWDLQSGGGHAFTDDKGRVAFGFEWLAEGLRTSFQSKNHGGATEHTCAVEYDTTGMARGTSYLGQRTEIVYDEEIPLVLQVTTSKSSFESCGPETFFTPEIYENYGYEYVYALTISFSQKSLEELSGK